ncbi:MAG: transcriptional regulator [Desulfobacterales bacterium]|nr:transcriptional regulator [Desulfobacterales bacterium]
MPQTRFDIFSKKVSDVIGLRNQNELSAVIGVNSSSITQARKRDKIPANWILQLCLKYGLNPNWLKKDIGPVFIQPFNNAEEEFMQIPKVRARLCAGGGSFEVGSEIEGYYSFRKDWLSRKGNADKMVLMDIFGNSMEPELKEGDVVLIDESKKDILAGSIYAVGIDDTIMVKRLEKRPKGLALLSENIKNETIYMEGEDLNRVRLIGKVLWVGREFK